MTQRYTALAFLLSVSMHLSGQFSLETNLIFGGNSGDEARHLAATINGLFLFFGARSFSNDVDVPGNAGASDYWIMKRDIDGSPVWSRTYGSTGNDDLVCVMPHPDGGVMAFGTTQTSHGIFGTLNGLSGGWLIRTTPTGALFNGTIYGGQITELAVDAVRHTSGNVTLLLESTSPVLMGQNNNGGTDAWIVRVDQALLPVWSLLTGGGGDDKPTALDADNNTNLYVLANTESDLPGLDPNQGATDLWVFKLDQDGDMIWQITLGGSDTDTGTDILAHENGSVYVLAYSRSSDGDFPQNEGLNDLWLFRLDGASGDLLSSNRYGGSGNDFNGKLTLMSDESLIISATTTSDDIDLSGNKGLSDLWILNTDQQGHFLQQMNYGGSLNDAAGGIVVVDDVIHVQATTFSIDKNVPPNNLGQHDIWYFTLNTHPDSCTTQLLCDPDTILNNHLLPPDDEMLLCAGGCTAGLGPGPNITSAACSIFEHPTAYYFITTDTLADLLTLSVSSFEFNRPQLALFKSINCTFFQLVECAIGEDGEVLLPFINIDPLTTYVVAVSDAEGNIGYFELCTSSIDVDFCNVQDRIFVTQTSLGSPLQGPYLPGEEVLICYELQSWNKLECNGFQGLMPSFGPGWDSTSFDFNGRPVQMDTMLMPVAQGFWEWYPVGEVRYNVTNPVSGYEGGQGMPAGWYFTNTGHPPPNDNPDQTTGDINTCLPTPDTWKVCFTLKVVEECEGNLDCSVTMRTFSDGELGFTTNLACAYDQPEVFHAFMKCCVNPNIQLIQDFNICSGDTVILTPSTNLLPPVVYNWTADPDPFITGATPGSHATEFYQVLTSGAAIPLKVRYSIFADSDGCKTANEPFEITVLPSPVCTLTLDGPSVVCSGSTVALHFESRGAPPFVIGLYRNNEFFTNVLSETPVETILIDPVFSGTFSIGALSDASCEGSGFGSVSITVLPVSTSVIDTTICEGASFTVGDTTYTEAGIYTDVLPGAAQNGCDSIVSLSLGVIPSVTQTVTDEICRGDTLFVQGIPFTQTTDEIITYTDDEGCNQYIHLILTVRDTFLTEFEQTICGGDTVIFHGALIYESGIYSHVTEVRPGCFHAEVLQLTVLPAIRINEVVIIGDNGSGNGQILLEIVGGAPPYTFLWSNDHMTESLFGLSHGVYVLTVTGSDGCVRTFTFEVPFISSSSDAGYAPATISVSPALITAGDVLYISNQGTSPLVVRSAEWIAPDGKSIPGHLAGALDPGSSITTRAPQHLTAGVYYLSLYVDGGMILRKKILLKTKN